jgi:hypothetical protein
MLFVFSQIQASEKLRFIGDVNIATGDKFKETEIGGLSGLFFDQKNSKILAISDDRSVVNNARFYEFNIKLDTKSVAITPNEVITLKDETGTPFKKHTIDFEGITLVNDDILISSEGALNQEHPELPGLFKFSRDGKLKERLSIPTKFLPDPKNKDSKFGPRDNLVFEALSASKDGKFFLMGMEEALFQDDSISTTNHSSTTRIIQYNDFKPGKEFAYELDQVPAIKVGGLTVGETGLVDIAVIDDNNFYTLERSYLPLAKKNVIKIFKVTDFQKAQDISSLESIKGKQVKALNKELILNLDDIISQLNPNFKKLDNIEGICFGPILENGHQSIIVVSDNNFNKNQRTLFIAFEIIP